MSDKLKVQQEEEEEEEAESITSPEDSLPPRWSAMPPPLVNLSAAPGGDPPW
jgi:hypothetical protein